MLPEFDPSGAPSAPMSLPVLVTRAGSAARLSADGVIEEMDRKAAAELFKTEVHLACHIGFTARRLGLSEPGRRATGLPAHLDVAELFAFVHPARPIIPSPLGLARALGLERPASIEDMALMLPTAADQLLADIARKSEADLDEIRALASAAGRAGWPWAPFIEARCGPSAHRTGAFETWKRLREWEDQRPRGEPGSQPIVESEAKLWLAEILGPERERRTTQFEFAAEAAHAFAPRERKGVGHTVLAEAGTGIGKTLGYLSPATLWARRNDGAAWVSTFTKNLQRQIDQELSRVFPDPIEKREKVSILKGRENYLCLLNFEEAAGGFALAPAREAVFLALVARWIPATRDGDIVGGDFPSWISAEYAGTGQLTDRRGECVYGACRHYRRCFIERNNRQAGRAEIVVANHALVMSRAAMNPRAIDESGAPDGASERATPARYVFDEGHHLFDAADGVFASHLTVSEGAELRRWLRGRDGGRGRGRVRGLRERIAEALSVSDDLEGLVDQVERAAAILPAEGWLQRLRDEVPFGPFERFVAATRTQVLARSRDGASDYDMECEPDPPLDIVVETAAALSSALKALMQPMTALADVIATFLENEETDLEMADLGRLRAAARGLKRRAQFMIANWIAMLARIGVGETPAGFVDWFGISREAGREADAGFFRHYLDPTLPFSNEVLLHAHGTLITSATLRDRGVEDASGEADWRHAELRTGAQHLIEPPRRAAFGSPFDYAHQSRVLVVTDVDLDDAQAVSTAYHRLFTASGGGALGLFTSIRRLREVYRRIAPKLEDAGLPLYAQHVDALDAGTLVDLFREEDNASLLGTDAMRDGVDVPGRSLRLVVFDRVPWPRPDILHKARSKGLGIAKYNDVIVRMRLAQAFGRLIRQEGDKGVFIMLGAATPSRTLSGLPPGAVPIRMTLTEACDLVRDFVG